MPSSVLAQGVDKELDTPYVPTPQAVVDRMLELAQVKPGDTVVDLGSGDGRIMITAAQKYGARGFGVELDPRLVRRSNDGARRAGVADRVKFLQQDLFKTDFHEADVLTLYLLPGMMVDLRSKIFNELTPGARRTPSGHQAASRGHDDAVRLLLGTSPGQAAQSGNQLIALQTNQLADLTAVMASIARAQSLECARAVAGQAQARQQMERFLTYGSGYQAQTVQMFH